MVDLFGALAERVGVLVELRWVVFIGRIIPTHVETLHLDGREGRWGRGRNGVWPEPRVAQSLGKKVGMDEGGNVKVKGTAAYFVV